MKKLIYVLILFSLVFYSNSFASEIEFYEWGTITSIVTTVDYSGTTKDFKTTSYIDSNKVDLYTSGYIGAVFTVEYDPNGITDYPIFSIYGSIDGVNYDSPACPILTINGLNIDNGASNNFSIKIENYPFLKFRYKSSGTNHFQGCRIKYRPFRIKKIKVIP